MKYDEGDENKADENKSILLTFTLFLEGKLVQLKIVHSFQKEASKCLCKAS